MAISDFVKRKLALAFYRFDRDKDGVVDEADFSALGDAVAKLQGVQEGSEQYELVIAAHLGWWEAYFKGGDSDGDGKVTLEEYFAHVGAWLQASPDAMAGVVKSNESFFDAIDVDGNGELSAEEFSTYLQAYGLTDADARTAFSHLDLDDDGTMSREEFAQNISEYYISDERGPSEWFFGGH